MKKIINFVRKVNTLIILLILFNVKLSIQSILNINLPLKNECSNSCRTFIESKTEKKDEQFYLKNIDSLYCQKKYITLKKRQYEIKKTFDQDFNISKRKHIEKRDKNKIKNYKLNKIKYKNMPFLDTLQIFVSKRIKKKYKINKFKNLNKLNDYKLRFSNSVKNNIRISLNTKALKNNININSNLLKSANMVKEKNQKIAIILEIMTSFTKLSTPLYFLLIGYILSEVNSIFKRKFDFKILETLNYKDLEKLKNILNILIKTLDKLHESIKDKNEDDFYFFAYIVTKQDLLSMKKNIYANIFEFLKIVEKSRTLVLIFYKAIIKYILNDTNDKKVFKINSLKFNTIKTFIIVLTNACNDDYKKLKNEFFYVFSNFNDHLNERNFNISNLDEFYTSNEFFNVLDYIKYKNFNIFYECIYDFFRINYNLLSNDLIDEKIWIDAFSAYSNDSKLFFSLIKYYQQKNGMIEGHTKNKINLVTNKLQRIDYLIVTYNLIKKKYNAVEFEEIIEAKKISQIESDLLVPTKEEIISFIKKEEYKSSVEWDFFIYIYFLLYPKYMFLCYSAVKKYN